MRKCLPPSSRCILAVVASIFLFACSRPPTGTGLYKVTLQADWYPQPEHGGSHTALVKGYYKDAGLDVSIQPGRPYVSVEQQVSAGAAQLGMTSPDKILESIADGQQLIAAAATTQHGADLGRMNAQCWDMMYKQLVNLN